MLTRAQASASSTCVRDPSPHSSATSLMPVAQPPVASCTACACSIPMRMPMPASSAPASSTDRRRSASPTSLSAPSTRIFAIGNLSA